MPELTGRVRAWIEHKAYGFINPDDGSDELFFHRKDLRGEARDEGVLKEGDTVTYEKGYDERNKKDKACNISIAKSDSREDKAEAMLLRKDRESKARRKDKKSRSPTPPSPRRRSPSTHKARKATEREKEKSGKKRRRSPSRSRSRKDKDRDRDRRRRRSKSRSRRSRSRSARVADVADDRRRHPLGYMSDVQTFSDFVRIAETIQKEVPRIMTHDLAEVIATAAKVKFYDGDMLEAITTQLKNRFTAKGEDKFTEDGIVKVLSALAELNAYNKGFFSACGAILAASPERLTAGQAKGALRAFKATKHEGMEDFMSFLIQKTKHENYEAAKSDLFKRQLNKMYGETMDLQGAPMDAERALLKKPRPAAGY